MFISIELTALQPPPPTPTTLIIQGLSPPSGMMAPLVSAIFLLLVVLVPTLLNDPSSLRRLNPVNIVPRGGCHEPLLIALSNDTDDDDNGDEDEDALSLLFCSDVVDVEGICISGR